MKTMLLRSASTMVMTVMAFALPFTTLAQSEGSSFRTEDWSAQKVISSFENPGGSTSTSFDNGSLSKSGFDFTAFFSHPCYEPIGEHLIDACQSRYGVYGNLKTASTATVFRSLLVEKFGSGVLGLLGSATTDYTEQEAADAAEEASDADTVSFYGDLRARRIQLWNICKERFEDNAAACYQDNLRLLFAEELTIGGNVYHHSSR